METIEIGKKIKQSLNGEDYIAFIPNPFPSKRLNIFSPEILKKSSEAGRLIGKLDGITKLLPDSDFFILMYLRKDAASSSQIEGTMATMVDAIEAEVKTSDSVPDDVDDILHYIKALNYGMKRMENGNVPFSLRFIRDLHLQLMTDARSTHYSAPGEFRKSQNWIGGTKPSNSVFVPPPPQEMLKSLDDLEKYINANDNVPTIIKAGIIHSQFELIHPFLDGNGRTGRMLTTFFLWSQQYLEKPILFLSSYFKKYQKTYYQRLENYHEGQVERWIDFFLDGVIEISNEAIESVASITEIRERDMKKVQQLGKRSAESIMQVLTKLYGQPIVNSATIQGWTGFSREGANRLIKKMINLNILTKKDKDVKYGQSYIYSDYVRIFADK
ncbi:MAG: Filamentation induced by cAMP protein Fic [candidate division WS6 bacterium GW2011_GWF2_39_15]|uniref:Filamentation induced by cAMP protein Fic n=1 Tax=candidate division WS6 bacterium GW2011_GWF2_39_15 TaxID=1619100 RepID=A0A0G0MZ21_9BACT|nr:MAG: Filamentation induced by cAMP protein Fic [candidate division WS6 bacterium GW2011_GWF2_39_15]